MGDSRDGKCACCGDYLDRFIQPVVLSILKKEPLTGYGVLQKISDYTTFESAGPDATGVYRYLKIMKSKGLIRQTEDGFGRAQLYEITPRGRECLQTWSGTLRAYAEQIRALADELS